MLHILQCINKFVIKSFTVLKLLGEIRELKENLPEVRVHHLTVFPVGYNSIRTELFFQSRLPEVHQEDTVYRREPVSGPVVFLHRFPQQKIIFLLLVRLSHFQFTLFSPLLAQVLHLPADSPAHIEQCAVQKAAVEPVLHLHDDIFPRIRQAVQVVDDPRIRHAVGVILLIQKNQVLDTMLSRQQFVQERDKQFLASRLSEYNFESDIGKRVHKVPASQIHTVHISSFPCFVLQKNFLSVILSSDHALFPIVTQSVHIRLSRQPRLFQVACMHLVVDNYKVSK